jgi:uncharacterized protein
VDAASPLDRIERDHPVIADPTAQLALLELQGLDTELSQLAHRRRSHPVLNAIGAFQRQLAELHLRSVELETAVGDVAKEQARLEADIDLVRQREVRDQQRLAAGGIPAKELSGLEHELDSLKRRQGTLEDEALEIMEQREAAEAELERVRTEEGSLLRELAAAEEERDAAFAQIDADAAARRQAREPLAGSIPSDLLDLYDRIRAGHDGVGAAALRQRRCEGCRIELSGSELNAVRSAAPEDVVRCDNCRRILVRTAESGL